MVYNNRTAFYISLASGIIGMLYFAFAHEWLIIQSPFDITTISNTGHLVVKKNLRLIYWQHDQWKHETQEILWTHDLGKNIYQTINAWLTVLDEEDIIHKKVTLQSALISPNKYDVYISFDHNPLPKERSTFYKWMLIEGLLKTLRENELNIQNVQFLVYHQPLKNQHLDFSKPWPVQGFLET